MDELRQALRVCPQDIRAQIANLPLAERIEEVRFRAGQEVHVLRGEKEVRVEGLICDANLLQRIVDSATAQSAYSVQDMLRQGFLTIPGGHRLGLCGTGVYRGGELVSLREIRSVCLRVARRIPGAALSAVQELWLHPVSTVILGAPGRGKTTLLRELIDGVSTQFGWRVAVVDERYELGGVLDGQPQFRLGACTDLLSGVRKAEGIAMLLRAMNPQWIAVDEITAAQDVEAIERASYCGVRFFATAHAYSVDDLHRRPVYRSLLACGVFQQALVLQPDRRIRRESLNC